MRGARRFRWLLRILPSEMREAHGRDMEQVFRDTYAERPRDGRGTIRFWLAVLLDILRVAPRQHLEAAVQDVRYAARSFRRTPGFTLTAILTIALGTGAATAIFAVVNAVLLRPLPFEEPDRVTIVWARNPDGNRLWLAPAELDDVRERVPSLQHVAGLTDLELALTGSGAPEQLHAVAASAALLDVFGVRPVRGRGFTAADDLASAPRVAILSEELWRRRFGGSETAIGAPVLLDGRSYTVIGVLPQRFRIPAPSAVFPSRIDVWVPLQPHLAFRGRDVRMLHVVARLGDGSTLADARGQLETMGRAVSAAYPEYRGRSWTFDATPLQDDVVKPVRPALLMLLAVVALVLFIASGNVAALLLSRGACRAEELAIRIALGASASRLTRQLVTEGLMLASIGGAAGFGLASLTPALGHLPPLASIPRFADIAIDWRVVMFAVALSLATAALFTPIPLALIVRRGTTQDGLRARGLGSMSIRAGRIFAVGEVALACVVLTVAVLLSRGFGALVSVDPGIATSNRLTFRVSLTPTYATGTAITGFFDRALEQLRVIPGMRNAAAVTQLPLSGASLASSFIVSRGDRARVDADLRGVSPEYFATLAITLVEGRGVERSDRVESKKVAIVDELFARRAWPGESALGKKMRWFRQPDVEVEVVGVVRPVRHRGYEAAARETVYRPYAQYVRPSMFVVVETSGPPLSYAHAVGAAMQQVDPQQPIAEVTSMEALAARSLAQPAFGAALASAFAAVALLLTMVGTYGLFAYSVAQRQREIGLRLALGGAPSAIVALIMREGLMLGALGVMFGVPAAFISSRAARNLLPVSAAVDLVTVMTTVVILMIAMSLACWVPARRASRVSPMASLRAD